MLVAMQHMILLLMLGIDHRLVFLLYRHVSRASWRKVAATLDHM